MCVCVCGCVCGVCVCRRPYVIKDGKSAGNTQSDAVSVQYMGKTLMRCLLGEVHAGYFEKADWAVMISVVGEGANACMTA